MKRAIAFLAMSAVAILMASAASAQVPLLSTQRLSFGVGVERAWQFEALDVAEQSGSQWFVKVPIAYTLPTSVPTAITARAEKSLTSREVGLRVGVQVVLYRAGRWVPQGGQ